MASNNSRELTIVLTGDAKGLTGTVRISREQLQELGADLDKVGGKAQQAGKKTAAAFDGVGGAVNRAKNLVLGFVSAAAAVQVGRGLLDMADTYTNIGARLRLASAGTSTFAAAQVAVLNVAQSTSTSLATVADLVSNLSTSFRSLGGEAALSFKAAVGLSKEITQSVALSGASATAANAALVQLGQGLASGTLRGDELNSVMEQTPRLAQAIAEGMGKTVGQLRSLGAQGMITAKDIVAALSSQREKIEAEFRTMPLTVGRAWEKLKNSVLSYVGVADQARGASSKIALAISAVADHIDDIARAVVALGKLVATVYATKMIASGIAWIGNLTAQSAAMAANGVAVEGWAAKTATSFSNARKNIGLLGIALNVVGAAVVGWQIGSYLRDQFLQVRLAGIALVDGLLTAWERIKEGALLAWAAVKAGWDVLVAGIKSGAKEAIGILATVLSGQGQDAAAAWLNNYAASINTTTNALQDFAAASAQIHAATNKSVAAIHENTTALADYEIAQENAKAATKAAVPPQDDMNATLAELLRQLGLTDPALADHGRVLDKLAQSYQQLAAWSNKVAGKAGSPFDEADAQYLATVREGAAAAAGVIASTDALVAKGHMSVAEAAKIEADAQRQVSEGISAANIVRDKAIEKITKQRDISGRMIEQMQRESQLASMSPRDQAMARAGWEYEQQARQQNLDLTKDQIAAERQRVEEAAGASFDMQRYAEMQKQIAQEYVGFWENAAGSTAKLFADGLTGQVHDLKDFARSGKSILQQWVSDIISQFLRLRALGPLLNGAMGAVAGWLGIGATGGAGSWLQLASQYYGGGSTIGSAAGALGGGGGGGSGGSYGGMVSNISTARNAYNWAFGSGGTGAPFGGSIVGGSYITGPGLGTGAAGTAGSAGYAVNMPNGAVMYTGNGTMVSPATPYGGYIGNTGLSYAGVAGGLAGAYWGSQRGSGGVSTGAATVTGAVGGYYAGAAVATAMSSGVAAGLAAIPVVGWIALAAMLVDQISGGKLFGTKYKTAAINSSMSIGAGGADASLSLYQTKQRALFGGRKTRAVDQAVPPELQQAADSLYEGVRQTMVQGAQKLAIDVPAMITASLKTHVALNDKGQVRSTDYVVEYLGRTWKEATAEAASKRIGAEALVATVAASAGAVAQQIAEQWRSSAETLLDGAQLMLAAQVDINHGNSLLALGAQATLAQVVEFTKSMQADGEKLADTYARLAQASAQYLQFVGQFEPASNGFGSALQAIAKQMQANIDQANALAQAAGLQHAREADLANIHRVAAEQAAAAIAQLSAAAQDLAGKLYGVTGDTLASVNAQIDKLQGKLQTATQLAIGDNSPLSEKEKLDVALKGLRSGITSADDVLSLGRKLYASSADYAGLYAKVQEILQLPGAGQTGAAGIGSALDEYNGLIGKRDQLQSQAAAMARFNDAKTLAQYVADISTTHGIGYGEAASGLGFSLQDLAKDLGVTNLVGYLDNLKLADIPGSTMDASASIVTAIQQLGRDLIQTLTGGPITSASVTAPTAIGSTDPQVRALLEQINQRLASIDSSSGDTAATNKQMAKQGAAADLRDITRSPRNLSSNA